MYFMSSTAPPKIIVIHKEWIKEEDHLGVWLQLVEVLERITVQYYTSSNFEALIFAPWPSPHRLETANLMILPYKQYWQQLLFQLLFKKF